MKSIFNWEVFCRLHRFNAKNKLHSLERLQLFYIHHPERLTYLARSINKLKKYKHSSVSVQTIWIDGTPQAKAKKLNGLTFNCELADLLLIIEERDKNNNLILEKGLLLQGKSTPRHNKLTAGSSTQKERDLLERVDTNSVLYLYKDMSLTSKIGEYNISGFTCAFSECARYLLMPKNLNWISQSNTTSPLQVGWPKNSITPYIKPPYSFVDAVNIMASSNLIGKKITDPQKCEWSKIVNDLKNNYESNSINRFGGQSRIVHSNNYIMICANNQLPRKESNNIIVDFSGSRVPYISIMKIIISAG